jgi:AraC-like DNA-binding protein
MNDKGIIKQETIRIKNMIGNSCIRLLQFAFKDVGIEVVSISLGQAIIKYEEGRFTEYDLSKLLQENGFALIVDREKLIVEDIKLAVIELIHHLNNVDSIVRKSEYLVEKLKMSYQQISKIFSKHEPITLERYVILNKIERIKELILSDEYTLSEIAYMMDYSSVQYLSNQFKKEVGMTVSEFKECDVPPKKALEDLY